jgi:TonB family protein
MAAKANIAENENRTTAFIGSSLFHALLLAILIFYRFSSSEPVTESPAILIDMGGGGDNAAAGLPDQGQGDEPAPIGEQLEDPASTQPADVPEPTPAKPTPPASKPATPTPSTPTNINTPTSNDPDVAALKKAEADKRKQQQEEQDRIRKQQDEQRIAAENERRRQQEEADRKRREQEERDAKKGKFGSAFGKPGGTGTGQGNTGKPGNQGIPGGTGDNPFGKSNGDGGGSGGGSGTGTGASVGGGLGGRKALDRVKPSYNSNNEGVVRVAICVNDDGSVSSAKSTLQGSTTTDGSLRSAAEAAARRWKFAASPGSGEQCGWIDFNFKLK